MVVGEFTSLQASASWTGSTTDGIEDGGNRVCENETERRRARFREREREREREKERERETERERERERDGTEEGMKI
jgi:hypothetical protein